MTFSKDRTGSGTREWSETSRNICTGCSHGCIYCYARYNAIIKYKTVRGADDWLNEKVNMYSAKKKIFKKNGVVMFPTQHDITPTNLDACLFAIQNELRTGNELLIVSKPHLYCIQEICRRFLDYRKQILFRFTVSSTDRILLKLFESGAPSPEERIESLKYAFERGFQTSVSSEPLLGGIETADQIIAATSPFVSDTIWIGKLNNPQERILFITSAIEEYLKKIQVLQSDVEVMKLYEKYKNNPKIKWKDSIKEVVERT